MSRFLERTISIIDDDEAYVQDILITPPFAMVRLFQGENNTHDVVLRFPELEQPGPQRDQTLLSLSKMKGSRVILLSFTRTTVETKSFPTGFIMGGGLILEVETHVYRMKWDDPAQLLQFQKEINQGLS